MIITPGSTSQSVTVQIVDDSGLAVTGLVAATFPTTSYERVAEALTGISLSDLSLLTSAYASGGVKEVGGGYYRLDVPDAAFATASKVRIVGEASGKHVLYPVITCAYLAADVKQLLGTPWLTPAVAGTPDVNARQVGGTPQTARDLGASVLVGDKTGFSLAQTFPANFAALAITAGGEVTAGAAPDPWATAEPGGYAAGTFGYLASTDLPLIAQVLGKLNAAGLSVTASSVVPADGGTVKLVAGDDYYAADGRALTWSVSGTPSLAGATVQVLIYAHQAGGDVVLTLSCAVTATAPGYDLSAEVSQVQSLALLTSTAGAPVKYAVRATLAGGHVDTLVVGKLLAG